MEENIKVSIITVCYNSEKTIRRTIESVLNQTYDNIEYIIVDGASTDQTMDIVKEYEPRFSGRMRWISEPDEGIYFAMNKGIDMAAGELIGLLNSDDTYESNAVKSIRDALVSEPYQILYGFARVYTKNRMNSISILSHHSLPERMLNHTACFVTKNVYRDFAKFDTKYVSAADYDFMLKMFYNPSITFVPVYTLISNFYSGGMSSTELAYMDLQKMQFNYGMISRGKYIWRYVQHLIHTLLSHK